MVPIDASTSKERGILVRCTNIMSVASCFVFVLFIFFAEMLGLSFWFELVLYGDICHQGGEDAHRELREAHWRFPYSTTSSHLVFGAEVLAVRASTSQPWQTPP